MNKKYLNLAICLIVAVVVVCLASPLFKFLGIILGIIAIAFIVKILIEKYSKDGKLPFL